MAADTTADALQAGPDLRLRSRNMAPLAREAFGAKRLSLPYRPRERDWIKVKNRSY